MSIAQVIVLAIIQGLAELLPVSSSAHVIVVGSMMGFDPGSPEGTYLLIMLHTGTMFAVLAHFWPRWRERFTQAGECKAFVTQLVIATVATGVLGLSLKLLIEKCFLPGGSKAEIEHLFRNLPLIAASLFSVGIFILAAAYLEPRRPKSPLTPRAALIIGAVQGYCLPFRGFSRSGATISTGM